MFNSEVFQKHAAGMDEIFVDAIPGFREPVSCFTHLVAVFGFAILSFYLIRRGRGSRIRTISLSVMAFSTVFLLSMSTVYHLLWPGPGRSVMRQLDIAGVFALIAGTVTPLHAILFRGFHRWAPLLIAWSAAIAGITLRTIYSDSLPPGAGTAIFLLLGWGGLISCVLLWRRYGFLFVKPLLWGGVAYTLGVIVLGLNWPILIPRVVGAHELWHVAVLIGLGLHWKFVFQFAHGPPVVNAEQDYLAIIEKAMTSDESLRQSLATIDVNEDFTEAVIRLHDNSRLCFCHRVGERWAKAVGPEEREHEGAEAGELLSAIKMFRLNRRHLDIEFEDGSRWDEALQDFQPPNR